MARSIAVSKEGRMRFIFQSACALVLIASCAVADQIGTFSYQERARFRAENGLVISWQTNYTDSKGEIQVYDVHGVLLTHFAVLDLVPEAKSVSVWDVSAQPGKVIAVGAVYAKPGSVENSLMLFNFDGKLKSAFALAPSRGVGLLVLDDHLDIWTVTASTGDQPPSAVPMVVEYDPSGREMRELLTRDAFQQHAQFIHMTAKTGHPNIGFDSGYVWFWLPGSTDLVTIQAGSGAVNRLTTGLPSLANGVVPYTLFRLSATRYILTARGRYPDKSGNPVDPVYVWSADAKQWTSADPLTDCGEDPVVLGVQDHNPLYGSRISHELCVGEVNPAQ